MKKFAGAILICLFPIIAHAAGSEEEIVRRPSRPPVKHVYLEEERIVGYFEVTRIDEYRKLIPSVFGMPERPLCRVVVRDFYKMESGPPYFESLVDILVKYRKPHGGEEISAWYCLEMPVTTEEALWGRFVFGFPKVIRRVTFERCENRYVGTSYTRDGNAPALTLVLEPRKARLAPEEKAFLDFVSPIPSLTIKDGKVLNWGAGKYKIYEMEKVAPQIWTLQFGNCSLEYPDDPQNYLHRLGPGKFITGYWLKQKYRYGLKPKDE